MILKPSNGGGDNITNISYRLLTWKKESSPLGLTGERSSVEGVLGRERKGLEVRESESLPCRERRRLDRLWLSEGSNSRKDNWKEEKQM